MVSVDGELVGLPPQVRKQLESAIAEQTGGKVQARGGKGATEWVVGRRDLDVLLFCRRLPRASVKNVARGALRPDLASLLVKASRPDRRDVFLDPFGGSGAIVSARLAQPLRRAIYSDLRAEQHREELGPDIVRSRRVEVLADDALVLPHVDDDAVSAVVTDPPWGEHEDVAGWYEDFAAAMTGSFDRVLHPRHGRLVVPSGRRVAPTLADAWHGSGVKLNATHEILVNGHPASVLVGGR